ncbi:MAG: hypothetical protein U0871_03580 [Gemmataceae bacterium]
MALPNRWRQPVGTQYRLWAVLSVVAFVLLAVTIWMPAGKGEASLVEMWRDGVVSDQTGSVFPQAIFATLVTATFAAVVGWAGQAIIGCVAAVARCRWRTSATRSA